MQTKTINEILEAKAAAGANAYLWLSSSGDCILWPDEASSKDDDGAQAIGRWQVAEDEINALIDTGAVDDVV